MSMTMFIDESKANGYIIAATVVGDVKLAETRALLRELVLPGQRRIHFAKESDRRRRHVLSAMAASASYTYVYRVHGQREFAARQSVSRPPPT